MEARESSAKALAVAAAVDNAADLLAAVTIHQPDVAIVDVRLPPAFTDEGLRAALTARREVPGLPVLVLSQYVEQLVCSGAAWLGASSCALVREQFGGGRNPAR